MRGLQVEQTLIMMAALVDKNREEAAIKAEREDWLSIAVEASETQSSSMR
jgi:hypothetical protein